MANFLDRVKLKVAQDKRTKFDLSCRHVTTQEFMKAQPIYYRSLVPNQSLDIDVRAQLRMTAMVTPTFGAAKLHLRAFWIPFSVVWSPWYDFITDSPHCYPDGRVAIPQGVPYVTNEDLVRLIVNFSNHSSATSTPDFVILQSTPPVEDIEAGNYLFTPKGRQVYKFLQSLGYNLSTDLGNRDESLQHLSALPLLCALRVYLDWYYPAQYVGDATYTRLNSIFAYNTETDVWRISYADLLLCFEQAFLNVCYDSDYFTSAFDNPTGPNQPAASDVFIDDVNKAPLDADTYIGSVQSSSYTDEFYANTPFVSPSNYLPSDNKLGAFSQFALQALQQLTSYMKRHQLAGNRAVDRFLARFGIKPSDDILRRSRFIGSFDLDLDVRSIESTADTSGANLGAYAGQGQFRGDSPHWSVDAGSDYGLFVVFSSIVPKIGYYQGVDPSLLRLTRLDQFTPEFDGLGTEAISKAELFTKFVDGSFSASFGNLFEKVFGFKPRYADYKCGRDWLTGDFTVRSLSQAGDTSNSWHLFRDMRPFITGAEDEDDLAHSYEFITGEDASQFNRIFYNADQAADHFIANYLFRVISSAPMRSLYDSIDFEHEEGKDIRLETNGVRVN